MDEIDNKLNGLSYNNLPDILPGTQNDFIKVNSSASDYELTDLSSLINPSTSGQILNSTGINSYAWSSNPVTTSINVSSGTSNGLKFGNVNDNNKIISSSTAIDTYITNNIKTRTDNTGLSIFGTLSPNGLINQTSSTGNNSYNVSGSHNFSGTNLILSGTCGLSSTSGNISTGANISGGTIKTTAQGTGTLNCIRVVDDNTGIYQPISGTGTMVISANGTDCLNFTSLRTQTQNIFNFGRGFSLQSGIYNLNQSNTILSSTQPLLLSQTPSSGAQIFDFLASNNYFGGQVYYILTRDTGGSGVCQYRAQNITYHYNGSTKTTIASNTLHNLTLDRFHILIVNIDGGANYLIQQN